ncbi:hypothetical protein L6258_00315, partial [Candidatus Parcubacteria bacterium]|nr:hypothetical protein [Candidatus Parcubacteria bacterium]
MAGRNIRRRKAVGGQRRRKNIAGSQVLVSSEEQVFRVLVSKFLKGTLSTGDPEGTMFFFLGSWLKGLPDLDMTKNLATKERRDVNEVCVEPFEFVEQFRELLEDRRKESFEDAVAWLAQNFSSTDWKRAVQWCGVKRILGLFAGGRAPEKDDIEKTSQDYGLTPEETKVLGLGWLKDVVDLDKAHLGLEDQERRGVLTRKEVDDKL